VALVIQDKLRAPVRTSFEQGGIVLSCSTATGHAQERVSVQGGASSFEIGFNHRYLMEALAAYNGEQVRMRINGAAMPVLIVPMEGDGFLHMVLPVRLKEGV
jgi:DNA polymerase-3 subunit beta